MRSCTCASLYFHSFRCRDIKPANILLDQNFVSKLGDVGLADIAPQLAPGTNLAAATHVSSPGDFGVGTFAYIDPEYMNEGHFGPASDVYSFGLVLLQLLTARAPLGLRKAVSQVIISRCLMNIEKRPRRAGPPVTLKATESTEWRPSCRQKTTSANNPWYRSRDRTPAPSNAAFFVESPRSACIKDPSTRRRQTQTEL